MLNHLIDPFVFAAPDSVYVPLCSVPCLRNPCCVPLSAVTFRYPSPFAVLFAVIFEEQAAGYHGSSGGICLSCKGNMYFLLI